MEVLTLISLLLFKHFIIDFPLQYPYQYLNKGTYLHPGGILHSGLHGVATAVIFLWYSHYFILFGVVDAILHYHIDWIKMNLNQKLNWKPNTHEQFWWLLGFDQLLHQLTYVSMIYFYIT